MSRPKLIGLCGGSGSGKTYFAQALFSGLGSENCEIVFQDNFYKDQSDKFDFDGGSVNFDHPDSIDFSLLTECVKTVKAGSPVEIPIYDFATHKRLAKTIRIAPKPYILVDGILILHAQELRDLFDLTLFFDTPEQTRFQRRLLRDVKERGRSSDGVRTQFTNQVKPMHDLFVEPCKAFADIVVDESAETSSLVKHVIERM